jgi:uncharacterized protein
LKVAIISDVHNNTVNLQKVLTYCRDNGIKTIICCGDLASQETLDHLNDNFMGTIHYIFGNMDNNQLRDFEHVEKYKKTMIHGQIGSTDIDGKKVAFVHFPELAKELCRSGEYAFVFYGHTHKPWEETIGGCKMLNPGNVAGEIYPPTFAVWDTKNGRFELVRVHQLP